MSQTLTGAVAALQTLASGLSGIKYAPAQVQNDIVQLPFAISFPGDGTFEGGYAHQSQNLAVIVTELHFSNQDMAKGIAQAIPYGDSFLAALVANPTLSSAVMAVVFPVTWTFGTLRWGSDGSAHIGYQFKITVKLENTF